MKLLIFCLLFGLSLQQTCTAKNCAKCATSSSIKCDTCIGGYFKTTQAANDCTEICSENCISCTTNSYCDTCNSKSVSSFYGGCLSCPNLCLTCKAGVQDPFSQTEPTPVCTSCTAGAELSGSQCFPAQEPLKSGYPLLALVTIGFGSVMVTLAGIAYCLSNKKEYEVPESGTASTGGASSTMMQMAGGPNASIGGFPGAAIA